MYSRKPDWLFWDWLQGMEILLQVLIRILEMQTAYEYVGSIGDSGDDDTSWGQELSHIVSWEGSFETQIYVEKFHNILLM